MKPTWYCGLSSPTMVPAWPLVTQSALTVSSWLPTKSVDVVRVWHNEQKKPWHVPKEKTRHEFAATTRSLLVAKTLLTIASQSELVGAGFYSRNTVSYVKNE